MLFLEEAYGAFNVFHRHFGFAVCVWMGCNASRCIDNVNTSILSMFDEDTTNPSRQKGKRS